MLICNFGFWGSSVFAEPEKLKAEGRKLEGIIGTLDVYIHQARDIHNICIYHKQDVYAKICLTSDPEKTVSTQTINGGGRNPVFNEKLRLNVRTIDSYLKCEIWMLSRVRNYLEDQLLGFALVPLSEVLVKNGKLEKEFSLSSTDLFHSPSRDLEVAEPLPSEFDKIEFPDPKIVNENQMMVSEYLDSQNRESFVSSDTENQHCSETEVHVESVSKHDSPLSSASTTNGKSQPKKKNIGDSESNATGGGSGSTIAKPVVTVNIEPEQKVVQQDIVDMYMKSMQQFTDSLAKMKLPMDIESPPTDSGNSSSDQNSQASKEYGLPGVLRE
ncbi:calcium-dependent lipid-binding (CaLB domain) family protein [Actinidia rufa]|uniref:Calcium-dependent lipid-binding (CaLB domain) family protein n=1 Tax=Actinidia rufa TaxID=165716 RepID=A0A7J0G2N0_9ERIC|nr:calcium-dependent lipid-binding (CaLB domain) family protein [Actinidia rufa]